MNNWTIGKRITVGFMAMVAISTAIGLFGFFSLKLVKVQSASLLDDSMPGALYMGGIKDNISQSYALLEKHLLATDADERAAVEKQFGQLSASNTDYLDKYQHTISTAEAQTRFDHLKATRQEYIKVLQAVFSLSRADRHDEAIDMLKKEFAPIYSSYSQEAGEMVGYNRDNSLKTGVTIERLMFSAVVWILIGLLVAVAMAVVVSYIVISSTNKALKRAINSIDEGSSQVASAAMQVSSASNTLAEGASEQAASLEETSASLEEMSSMTAHNATSAQEAKSIADAMHSAADGSAEQMKEMQRAMDAIKESSAGISQIIKTIDEIAFQTNILALNAAVEAARAGVAGAGFAVVAEEVRNLAQRSADSAKETSVKIAGAIRNSEQGVSLSAKVADSLAEIVEKAREMNTLVSEIATASQEQDRGISQLTSAVSQMDKVTQSNASNAEETASASEQLNAHAGTLKDTVMFLNHLVSRQGANGTSNGSSMNGTGTSVGVRSGHAAKPVAHTRQKVSGSSGSGGRFLPMSAGAEKKHQ